MDVKNEELYKVLKPIITSMVSSSKILDDIMDSCYIDSYSKENILEQLFYTLKDEIEKGNKKVVTL